MLHRQQKYGTTRLKTLQELWRFRSYVRSSIDRDFNLRYKGSALGSALIFLVPAFQILLYVLVFGNLLKGRLPGNPTMYGYSIYLCSGILFWNFFSDLVQRSQVVYLENANLLKKAAFPSSALSVVNFFSVSITLALSLAILLAFLVLTGQTPDWRVLGLIPIWLIVGSLALGIGLCIAVLQVFFRDFGALTTMGLQLLFWSTPIVYPAQILPHWLLPWIQLNPLVAPFGAAQAVMLGSELPPIQAWASTALLGGTSVLLAIRLHTRNRADLMDNL